jgi:hypothetical protein
MNIITLALDKNVWKIEIRNVDNETLNSVYVFSDGSIKEIKP